jgi:excisionase family DNA binding protein
MTDDALQPETAIPEPPIVFGERLTCSVAEAAQAVGLSRSKIYELINGGEVQTAKIGRRRLVSVSSLHKLTGIQPPAGTQHRVPSS